MKRDSDFVQSQRCPKCAERGKDQHGDNLSVWSDGHKYCFSCGYFVPPHSILLAESQETKPAWKAKEVMLPLDASPAIGAEAMTWLKMYKIRDAEIKKNHMLWSESNRSLIFPIHNVAGKLVAYQERFFGDNASKRWRSTGKIHEVPVTLSQKERDTLAPECVVLVEDVVSAIRLSRNFYASPLFGNNPPGDVLKALAFNFDYAILWLDYDQKDSVLYRRNQMSMYFENVGVVISREDPKRYTDEYMKREIMSTWRNMSHELETERTLH